MSDGLPGSETIVASILPVLNALRQFTDTAAHEPQLELHRQTRLLTMLLTGLIPMVTLAAGLHWLAVPEFGRTFAAVLLTVMVLISALLLNRQGHYRTGAVLTISATAAACYVAILLPPYETHAYAYLSISVLLAALLFGQVGIVVCGAINVVTLAFIVPQLGLPGPSLNIYAPAMFIFVVATLLALAIRHRDILENDRRRALADRERMLAKAEDVAQLGSWVWELPNNRLSWSKQMYQIYGLPSTTARSDLWEIMRDFTHADDQVHLHRFIELSLRQRDPTVAEFRITRADGMVRNIIAESHALNEPDGSARRRIGTLQDITERKRAEHALRRSEEQYRTIVETVQEGIWQFDVQQRTTFANPKMAEMLGYSAAEMAQRTLFEFMGDQDNAVVAAQIERCRQGFAEHHELAFRRKDGTVLWTRASTNPLHDAHGNYCGCLAMLTDITERKRNDDALHLLATGTAAYVGREFFTMLVQHLARALDVSYALVTECVDPATKKMRTLGFFAHGSVQPNFEYLLAGTPCEIVMDRGSECFFPEHLQSLFPNHPDLVNMGAHSYLGVPLTASSGKPLGHLCVLDTRPMHKMEWAAKIMTAFAERTAAELRRQRAEQQTQKLSSAVEQTADAVLITDRNGTIEYVNRAFEQISGYSAAEAVGQRPSLVKSGKHDVTYYQKLWRCLHAGEVYRDVLVNQRKSGELYFEEITISPLRDTAGVITHFISTGKDITERMQSQERLHFMAHHDALTELPNRALFLDRLSQSVAYARWHRRLVAIMFLDLDRFKHINDTLGHDAGDQLLRALATRLKATLRERDTVARFGGDEFAVLLDDVASEKDVALLANKVLETMKQPYLIGGHEFHLTASIGISLCPGDGHDNSSLLRNADIAMYRAKELGKNTYQFYSAEMSHRAFERLTLETSLRRALENQEFVVYYQPQVNMTTHELLGMEALLRWQHPELGLMAPTDFLALLEETGLIVAVGDWVLRSACEQAQAWHTAGLDPMRIAVNLSGHQLRQPNFFSTVTQLVKTCRLPSGCLELEITENVLMQDAERALSALSNVDRKAIRIAIDDFGTGYSSLSHLKRFPIDTLKIDRSFMRDLTTDPQDAAIVRSVIAMARSLNLDVVAEGVEHDEQLAFLRNEHCDVIQGYFVSPPLPAPEATAYIISHRAKC